MRFKKFISSTLALSMLTSTLPIVSVPASAADMTLTPSNTSGTLTITLKIKGTPTAPAEPIKSEVTKTSITLAAVTGCEYSKDGTTWQETPVFSGLTPGTEYTFYQRLKETDDNNASPASTAKISTLADTYDLVITLVIKDKAKFTTEPAAKENLVYSGTDVKLITAGTVEGGTAMYSLDGTNYSENIPTASAAGTYTVYYYAKGDTDHNDSEPKSLTAVVGAQGTLTITLTIAAHEHDFEYSATDATITANCKGRTGTCDLTSNPTLTLTAPTKTVYNDNGAADAAVTASENWTTENGLPAVPSVEYYNGTTKLNAAPTGAGSYTAKITVGSATASVDYTIAKADPTYTVPENLTAKYGQTLANVELPKGFSWTEPTTSVGDVGTNMFTVTYTPADTANFNTVSEISVKLVVEKAEQSAPTGLTSDNETIAGKNDGKINGLTNAMEISTTSATDGFEPVNGNSGNNLTAGTYYVRYAGDANHLASPAATVIINQGDMITVQFDTDGGTPAPANQSRTFAQTAERPEVNPEKPGYTFLYWSADGTSEYDFASELTQNITLKALWRINSYAIKFDTDGGSIVPTIVENFGTPINVPYAPTKPGYIFIGWDKPIPETMPAEDMIITALWSINGYAVTFDTDGGSYIAPISQTYGSKIYAPADPVKPGYTFIGWDKPIPETMPADNVTIRALWRINSCVVSFDSNGGSSVPSQTVSQNAVAVRPADPTRNGYTFMYWAYNGTQYNFNTPVNVNITLSAVWRENSTASSVPTVTPTYVTEPAGSIMPEISTGTGELHTLEPPAVQPVQTVSEKHEYGISGKQTAKAENELTWNEVPDANGYSLYIKVNGKDVFVQDLGEATSADIVRGTNGKYYVSTGDDYTVYTVKDSKFTKTGTLSADEIGTVKKANNVTTDFTVKYTKADGTVSTDAESLKTSVKVYYKPAAKAEVKGSKTILKWEKVPGATKYRVYRSRNGKMKLVTETDKTKVTIKTNSGEYTYAVRACVDGKWTEVTKTDLVTVTVG